MLQKASKPDSIGDKGSIQRLFDDLERGSPGFLDEMEENSALILDKLAPFMSDRVFEPMIPDMRRIVRQLHDWGFLAPIDDPEKEIYEGGYHSLSLPVHGSIDQTDVGSRLERGVNFLKIPTFDGPRLEHFIAHYDELLDVCLVLTLNLLAGDAPTLHGALLEVTSIPFYQQTPAHYFRENVQQRLAQAETT